MASLAIHEPGIGSARDPQSEVEQPCGHALNPEPGRVSRRLHAGSRSVGNQGQATWSLGIAAHWARHASGHNIGSNNHSGLEKKNHLFSMTSVSGPRGFERPTGRHPAKVPLKRLTEFGFVPTFRVRVGTICSRPVSVARSQPPPGVSVRQPSSSARLPSCFGVPLCS
jgi:hypothetical protein